MARLKSLRSFLARELNRVEMKVATRVNRAVVIMVRELAIATPVDTSQALSNWIVGIGAVDPSYITPWSPGFAGSTQAASVAETVAAAKVMLEGRKLGTRVFVSNSAPYIRKLNAGSSRQAPAGFVEGAVMKAQVSLRGRDE